MTIAFDDADQPVDTLSGGNQQKIILACVLAVGPRVLQVHDPTRRADIGAKRDLYAALVELLQAGVGIVMLSSEVDEHVELMDRGAHFPRAPRPLRARAGGARPKAVDRGILRPLGAPTSGIARPLAAVA